LAALRYCAGKADKIVSVVNVPESSIARESDLVLPILAGVEVGVASTKAFTCQLVVLYILALKAAQDRKTIAPTALSDHLSALRGLPATFGTALDESAPMQRTARRIAEARDVLFLGRGRMFPLALEGALKLKEISYIHAEGYASGELKHGPIALIDKHVPVVVMAPRDTLFDKTVSNMQEVMARKGKVVLISDAAGIREAGDGVFASIQMPEISEALTPILYALPAQLLAYHAAVAKGTDVDQPRNLAKSVTVE
jgi:glucosamine--fructose-6-phosphate aminotransferase (isomerizing)